jgi:K+-sensing histidine kinase KdpD
MKIFSLETKKHVVGWGIIISITINIISNFTFYDIRPCIQKTLFSFLSNNCKFYGWPWHYSIYEIHYLLYNLFFWILVSLVVLSLVRNFRKKNNPNILNVS